MEGWRRCIYQMDCSHLRPNLSLSLVCSMTSAVMQVPDEEELEAVPRPQDTSASSVAAQPGLVDKANDGMIDLTSEDADDVTHDVAELFSPPRITVRAQHFELCPGLAFDLLQGTDLCTVQGRATVWAYVEHHKPRFIVVSPPCTCSVRSCI